MDFRNSARGTELNSLTLISVAERVIAHLPGSTLEAVMEASLARLQRDVDEISQSIREPESPSGRRLRQDLSDQVEWLVEAGHIREVKTGTGDVVYHTTRTRGSAR